MLIGSLTSNTNRVCMYTNINPLLSAMEPDTYTWATHMRTRLLQIIGVFERRDQVKITELGREEESRNEGRSKRKILEEKCSDTIRSNQVMGEEEWFDHQTESKRERHFRS